MNTLQVPLLPGHLPLLGHTAALLRGPLAFLEAAAGHGDIVRLDIGRVPVYVVNSPELVHRVLTADSHLYGRGRVQEKVRPEVGNGLVFSEGEFHHHQRRLALPAFTRESLREYAGVMYTNVADVAASWIPGQQIILDQEMHALTSRLAYRTIFGSELRMEQVAELRTAVTSFLWATTLRSMLPDAFERVPGLGRRRYKAACARLHSRVDDLIRARMANPGRHFDLLSLLLAASGEGAEEPMSLAQLRAELVTFLLASTDTITATLTWLFYEMSGNAGIEERLRKEIDSTLAGRPLGFDDIPDLHYTRRVIDETLRLHSPGWIFMRRPLADLELGGLPVPAGTELFLNVRAVHRSPVFYPEPRSFDPDRWLSPPPREAFFPFGGGVHKCIGDHFSRIAITIAVATILPLWRFDLAEGQRVREIPLAAIRPSRIRATLGRPTSAMKAFP